LPEGAAMMAKDRGISDNQFLPEGVDSTFRQNRHGNSSRTLVGLD
jgi:hypothetical protein